MNEVMDIIDIEEVDQVYLDRQPIEDRMDPFRFYDELEFIRRYRLSKECVHLLIQRLQERLEPAVANARGKNFAFSMHAL